MSSKLALDCSLSALEFDIVKSAFAHMVREGLPGDSEARQIATRLTVDYCQKTPSDRLIASILMAARSTEPVPPFQTADSAVSEHSVTASQQEDGL